jgi:peptidoglycan/xylan/chitin deacetylase (PgdA/CDA1 family)
VPSGFDQHPRKDEFVLHLKSAARMGHELGQHGTMHGKNSLVSEFGCFLPVPFPGYSKQKERLEKGMNSFTRIVGRKPLGFRAPFYLHNIQTLKALANLRFKYDSSKTVFKPTHGVKFRSQLCRPLISDIEGIKQIPVTGDYTYYLSDSTFSNAIKRTLHDFEWVNSFKSDNSVFVLNNHTNRLADPEYKLLGNYLKAIVRRLSSKTHFMRLMDLV